MSGLRSLVNNEEPGKPLRAFAWRVAVCFPSGRVTVADDRTFTDRQKAATLAWSMQGEITRERSKAVAVATPFLDWSALFPQDRDVLASSMFRR